MMSTNFKKISLCAGILLTISGSTVNAADMDSFFGKVSRIADRVLTRHELNKKDKKVFEEPSKKPRIEKQKTNDTQQHNKKSNLRVRIEQFFQDNKQKIKNFAQNTGKHLGTHSLLYSLGLYFGYHHIVNKKATYSLYNFEDKLPEDLEQNLTSMCRTLGIKREKVKAKKVKSIKKKPLLPFFFADGAHMVGTDGLVFNRDTCKNTVAHELTHIKNKHAYIILGGALLSPIVVDTICLGLGKAFDQYKGKNTHLRRMFIVGKKIVRSSLFRATVSFICALKIIHACEHNADTSYAQKLCQTNDLDCGKTHGKMAIPILNIDLKHLGHPAH